MSLSSMFCSKFPKKLFGAAIGPNTVGKGWVSSPRRVYSKLGEEAGAHKTCLFDFHQKKGAKMTDFVGFLMPLQYSGLSISESHLQTRSSASIFDVSHMLQTKVHGKDGVEFIESLTVADVLGLKEGQGSLTLLMNSKGGIIDDLIVTKTRDGYLYVVSNAGRIEQDKQILEAACSSYKAGGRDVVLEFISDQALIALQGPFSAKVLQPLVEYDLSKQYFMNSTLATVCGTKGCRVTRCGYTGEDGFEISIPAQKAAEVAETLLGSTKARVELAGLGARDTLRLEAGLCLYGNEMNEETTPVEAVLTWTIGKRRKELANFSGADIVLKQIKQKPNRKRVGLGGLTSGPAARGSVTITDPESDQVVGNITSGCLSPSLKRNIAMGYVSLSYSKIGTKVNCNIRGKSFPYEVMKMPCVATNYYSPPKA